MSKHNAEVPSFMAKPVPPDCEPDPYMEEGRPAHEVKCYASEDDHHRCGGTDELIEIGSIKLGSTACLSLKTVGDEYDAFEFHKIDGAAFQEHIRKHGFKGVLSIYYDNKPLFLNMQYVESIKIDSISEACCECIREERIAFSGKKRK